MTKLRLLLADDHALVRDGLRALIQAEPDLTLVGEAADGETAYHDALRLRPDVVVMDLSMPGMGGAAATEQLRQACPELRVVVLTAQEDPGYMRRLLALGASGYVLKRSAATALIAAIRTAAAGEVYVDPSFGDSVQEDHAQLPNGTNPVGTGLATTATTELSEPEQEVLRLLARGYNKTEISNHLERSLAEVEAWKAHAMKQLGLASRVDLVRYAVQRGWLNEH